MDWGLLWSDVYGRSIAYLPLSMSFPDFPTEAEHCMRTVVAIKSSTTTLLDSALQAQETKPARSTTTA